MVPPGSGFLLGSRPRAPDSSAGRLCVSQPALSEQIRALEGQLGTELFTRRAQGVALTPAGAAPLTHARRVL
ncbi:LysR family transcriptional regulator, partial [Streptomyces sp. SID625]|nr:LysR family transcriptional regulator [Streptomyces sp. SID625]